MEGAVRIDYINIESTWKEGSITSQWEITPLRHLLRQQQRVPAEVESMTKRKLNKVSQIMVRSSNQNCKY